MSSWATMPVKIKPFQTPNFATMEMPPRPKQEGVHALPTVPLAELPVETLDELVSQWRKEVYEKAGKKLPEARLVP